MFAIPTLTRVRRRLFNNPHPRIKSRGQGSPPEVALSTSRTLSLFMGHVALILVPDGERNVPQHRPGLSAAFYIRAVKGGFTSGRFSATVGLANMGPSRCVRITAVMNHGPFEFQVTIIFMLDRSAWTRG